MNKKSGTSKDAADKLVRGIKRKTRKHYSAEEKIRIVLAGLRGEESIAALWLPSMRSNHPAPFVWRMRPIGWLLQNRQPASPRVLFWMRWR